MYYKYISTQNHNNNDAYMKKQTIKTNTSSGPYSSNYIFIPDNISNSNKIAGPSNSEVD